jgi:hypothetical protein
MLAFPLKQSHCDRGSSLERMVIYDQEKNRADRALSGLRVKITLSADECR